MAIFDKAKEKFQGFMQGGEQANRNRRSNGGTSGYHPVRGRNDSSTQPQPDVPPQGQFGSNVMPNNMFNGGANFERVASTGKQPVQNQGASQQTAKHRSFQDLLNRALGKQDKQNGTAKQQPVQPPQQPTGNVPYGQGQYFTNNPQGGNQNPYNSTQYGQGQYFQNGANSQNPNAQYTNPQYGTSQRFNTQYGGQQGQPTGYNNPPQGYTGQQPQGYNNPPQGYTGQQPGYSNPPQGYTGQQPGYNPQSGYTTPQQGYNNPPQGYTNPPRGTQSTGNTMNGTPVRGTPVQGTPVSGQPYTPNPQQPTGNQIPQVGVPESVNGNVRYFPGSFVGDDGISYRAVLNVVQVTSVSSCYRLIEFLQNNEILLVNAEDIADRMEARRCLDILYGACVVSRCKLTRVSRDTLYIIAPADVKLSAFDGIRRMGEQDIEANWPYPNDGGFTSSYGGMQGNYRAGGGYQNAR